MGHSGAGEIPEHGELESSSPFSGREAPNGTELTF